MENEVSEGDAQLPANAERLPTERSESLPAVYKAIRCIQIFLLAYTLMRLVGVGSNAMLLIDAINEYGVGYKNDPRCETSAEAEYKKHFARPYERFDNETLVLDALTADGKTTEDAQFPKILTSDELKQRYNTTIYKPHRLRFKLTSAIEQFKIFQYLQEQGEAGITASLDVVLVDSSAITLSGIPNHIKEKYPLLEQQIADIQRNAIERSQFFNQFYSQNDFSHDRHCAKQRLATLDDPLSPTQVKAMLSIIDTQEEKWRLLNKSYDDLTQGEIDWLVVEGSFTKGIFFNESLGLDQNQYLIIVAAREANPITYFRPANLMQIITLGMTGSNRAAGFTSDLIDPYGFNSAPNLLGGAGNGPTPLGNSTYFGPAHTISWVLAHELSHFNSNDPTGSITPHPLPDYYYHNLNQQALLAALEGDFSRYPFVFKNWFGQEKR